MRQSMAKQKVYAQMITDKSTFMQDAGFSSFITGSDNNSVGLLYYADKYIGKAKADSAEMFNDNIAITNIADSVHKFVNTQYISYLRYKELSETTKAQLRDIAFLCPFAFGDGVYVARGLLNIADSMQMNYTNICETGSAKTKSMINEDINEDVNMQIVLYPNPAKDLLTIEYTNTENTTGTLQFEIYDLMGKRLRESIVNPNQNTIVSTDALSQGIYLYKFLYKNKIVKKDKLVIIK